MNLRYPWKGIVYSIRNMIGSLFRRNQKKTIENDNILIHKDKRYVELEIFMELTSQVKAMQKIIKSLKKSKFKRSKKWEQELNKCIRCGYWTKRLDRIADDLSR